ncbi:hypothetical protein [Reinekea marinisedimentorum]|uniref:Uncharacterized protein n=1 Tax=Reinekea marinisedimentorum TaxID=230495 RepID=A0A4R3I2D9_9GAMM|nr:hypothetical protein [Reinekea marinisedimentorum]TCS39927.1 hypothetical protein BCF53_11117 [Reinekea marinisedimentorum]
MYIDPLTLFITAEIFVVYVIINVFLFYKSRLLKVLVALLKEMRFERLRRQQAKQNALALERKNNKGPTLSKQPAETQSPATESQGEIARLLEKLKQNHPQDLTNSLELDQAEQWLRIRFLELEQELLDGNIDEQTWQELALEAIERLKSESNEFQESIEHRKEDAEEERYTGQLETDLHEAQNKLTEAMIKIRQLEGELEDLKAISAPDENYMETPVQGKYEDQLYQLKCDNFDLNETINKLKLELQQMDPASQAAAYTDLLEQQISNLEQYIKSADVSTGLLEKEVTAAQARIAQLESGQSNTATGNSGTGESASLQPLQQHHETQTVVVETLKTNIEKLRAGEDAEALLNDQAQQIARLEQILKESKQCITILESELDQSHKDLSKLESEVARSKSEKLANKLDELSSVQDGQKSGLGELKNIVSEFQQGGDNSKLIEQHQQQVERLEGFLAESDTLIGQLEAEIEDLSTRLQQGGNTADNNSSDTQAGNASDENLAEMESLLHQYMSDTQSLLKTTARLEEENIELKQKLENLPSEPAETIIDFDDEEPPVVTDVEIVKPSKTNA